MPLQSVSPALQTQLPFVQVSLAAQAGLQGQVVPAMQVPLQLICPAEQLHCPPTHC